MYAAEICGDLGKQPTRVGAAYRGHRVSGAGEVAHDEATTDPIVGCELGDDFRSGRTDRAYQRGFRGVVERPADHHLGRRRAAQHETLTPTFERPALHVRPA